MKETEQSTRLYQRWKVSKGPILNVETWIYFNFFHSKNIDVLFSGTPKLTHLSIPTSNLPRPRT